MDTYQILKESFNYICLKSCTSYRHSSCQMLQGVENVITVWGEVGAQDDVCRSHCVQRLHARAQLAPVPDAGRPVSTAADHQLLLPWLNLSTHL